MAGNEAVRFISARWEKIRNQIQIQQSRTYGNSQSIKNGPQYYTDKKPFYKVSLFSSNLTIVHLINAYAALYIS